MLYISLTHRTGRNSLKLGNQIRIVKQQICLNVGISIYLLFIDIELPAVSMSM